MQSPLELLQNAYKYARVDEVQQRLRECKAQGVDISGIGGTLLIRACQLGRLEIAEYLLESGASVHSLDNNGSTALHWAAGGGKLALVELLLAHGADASAINNFNETPAHRAISVKSEASTGILSALVDAGMDLHVVGRTGWDQEGYTLLHYACHHSNTAAAKLLLELGLPVNARSEWGKTALQIAVVQDYVNHPPLVKLLLDHGADTTQTYEGGQKLLQLHLELNPSVAVMRLLVDHGLDLAEAIKPEDPPLHRLLNDLGNLTSPGNDVYEFLIYHGVPVNGHDSMGRTPLHVGCASDDFAQPYHNRFLLEHGAQDALVMEDARGFLPLHCAVATLQTGTWSVKAACIELLLDHGADPNAKTRDGRSALCLLVDIQRHSAREQCARLLCSRGAEWDESCERRLALMQQLMEAETLEGDDATDELRKSVVRVVREWKFKLNGMTASSTDNPLLILSGLRACIQFWAAEKANASGERVALSEIPREVSCQGEQRVLAWLEQQGLSTALHPSKRVKR